MIDPLLIGAFASGSGAEARPPEKFVSVALMLRLRLRPENEPAIGALGDW